MNTDNEENQIEFCSEKMLEVNEKDNIRSWEDVMSISNISPAVVNLHKGVVESKDFLETMKTNQWKAKMKRMVLTILRIEDLFRTSL